MITRSTLVEVGNKFRFLPHCIVQLAIEDRCRVNSGGPQALRFDLLFLHSRLRPSGVGTEAQDEDYGDKKERVLGRR